MLMVVELFYLLELKEKGILYVYFFKNVENLVLDYDKEGYWYLVCLLNMVLVYNFDKYKKEDLVFIFEDFVKREDLVGKILIFDLLKFGIVLVVVFVLSDKYGEEYFKNLVNLKVVVEFGLVVVIKLEIGEVVEIMIFEEFILKKREEENFILEVIYLEDGIIFILSIIMIVKEDMLVNKNIKVVEVLIDWFLLLVG